MHYTTDECHEILPRWRENIERYSKALNEAIDAQDWSALHSIAVQLRWAGTNLKLIANDLVEATRHA